MALNRLAATSDMSPLLGAERTSLGGILAKFRCYRFCIGASFCASRGYKEANNETSRCSKNHCRCCDDRALPCCCTDSSKNLSHWDAHGWAAYSAHGRDRKNAP